MDNGTPDSAAAEDFDDVLRPQGAGFDIGAFEYVGVGAAEGTSPHAASRKLGPTIVRGLLFLPTAGSHKPLTASLLDAAGRRVVELRAGANDVRALAPGVYFYRLECGDARTTRKVIKTD